MKQFLKIFFRDIRGISIRHFSELYFPKLDSGQWILMLNYLDTSEIFYFYCVCSHDFSQRMWIFRSFLTNTSVHICNALQFDAICSSLRIFILSSFIDRVLLTVCWTTEEENKGSVWKSAGVGAKLFLFGVILSFKAICRTRRVCECQIFDLRQYFIRKVVLIRRCRKCLLYFCWCLNTKQSFCSICFVKVLMFMELQTEEHFRVDGIFNLFRAYTTAIFLEKLNSVYFW